MKKFIKEIYPYLIVLVIVILVKQFIVSPIQVNGDSMYDTLRNNDIMILNKLAYKFNDIERFDIVVIKYEGRHLIKRVIGLPGDKIRIEDNKLYINDEYVEEPYLSSSTITENYELPNIIPTDYYFVLGDNRSVSLDSRNLGLFSKNQIEGKASLTIFPFGRFGFKE